MSLNILSLRIGIISLVTAVSLTGCATQQLQDTTVAVNESATDIYYQMVLQNLARTYEEPDGLPWGVELTSAGTAVNDTEQIGGTFSENYPAITHSVSLLGQRAFQRSWATQPVTNLSALMTLKQYYTAVVTYAMYHEDFDSPNSIHKHTAALLFLTNPSHPASPTNSIVPPVNKMALVQRGPSSTLAQTVDYSTGKISGSTVNSLDAANPPVAPDAPADKNHGGSIFSYKTLSKTTVTNKPRVNLIDIDLSDIHFCSGDAPPNTISGKYGNTSAFVYVNSKEMETLTRFTILVVATIDQVAPKAQVGTSSVGAQPLPLLNL